ncbi:MAG: hypothetical protein H8E21_15395 [Gammaproteobacteria bacterium]|nr:hypothetical protein [Gammaproteobacteria bacterium]
MKLDESPLRLLVKSYTSGLIDREQYLEVRQQLLKKLSSHGQITVEDVKNFHSIYHNTDTISSLKSYSFSDWVIIILGLLAAAALGIILYS